MDVTLTALLTGATLGVVVDVFGLSAIYKLHDPAAFQESVREYSWARDVPTGLVRLLVLVPVVELAIAGGAIPAATVRWASAASVMSALAFVGAVAVDRRTTISHCGCWGAISPDIPRAAFLARAAVVLVFAVAAAAAVLSGQTPSGAEIAVGTVLALPVAVLVLELPQLLHLVISQREAWRLT